MAASNSIAQVITTNTDSNEVETWGSCFVKVKGTWGGATAALQFKDPGGNWVTIDADSYTADFEKQGFFPSNTSTTVRVHVSGGTAQSLTVYILGAVRST